MTRLPKILFAAAASLVAISGIAFADTPDAAATDPAASPAPAATDPATPTTNPNDPSVSASTTEDRSAAWPTAIIDRPLTLNAGMVGAAASLGVAHLSLGMLGSATSEGLNVGGDYGVTDQIQIGASYGLTLHDFEAKGPLDVHALYRLAHGKLKAAAGARFHYDLNSEDGDVSLGARVQYDVAPTFAVYTGGDQLDLGLIRSAMGAPTPITLGVPVGVAFQANPNIYAYAETTLATFGLSNADNFYISDVTPAAIGAFYSPSNKLDVGVAATFFDLQHAGDVWGILATARIFKM